VKALALLAALGAVAHAEPDPDTRLSVIGSAFPIAAIGLGTLVGAAGTEAPIRDIGGVVAIGGALVGVVTPALGSFANHRYLTGGMAMRAGGLVVEAIGILRGFNNEIGECDDAGPCHHSATTYGLLAAGAALYLGGALLDIVEAHHAVEVVPTAIKTPSSTAPGLAVALRF